MWVSFAELPPRNAQEALTYEIVPKPEEKCKGTRFSPTPSRTPEPRNVKARPAGDWALRPLGHGGDMEGIEGKQRAVSQTPAWGRPGSALSLHHIGSWGLVPELFLTSHECPRVWAAQRQIQGLGHPCRERMVGEGGPVTQLPSGCF